MQGRREETYCVQISDDEASSMGAHYISPRAKKTLLKCQIPRDMRSCN